MRFIKTRADTFLNVETMHTANSIHVMRFLLARQEEIKVQKQHIFRVAVAVQIDGYWHHSANVQQALECLLNSFPDQQEASLVRAVTTCNALLSGTVSTEAAASAFIVAAMAAGLRFQTGDYDELMELELGQAINEGLRELIYRVDVDPETSQTP